MCCRCVVPVCCFVLQFSSIVGAVTPSGLLLLWPLLVLSLVHIVMGVVPGRACVLFRHTHIVSSCPMQTPPALSCSATNSSDRLSSKKRVLPDRGFKTFKVRTHTIPLQESTHCVSWPYINSSLCISWPCINSSLCTHTCVMAVPSSIALPPKMFVVCIFSTASCSIAAGLGCPPPEGHVLLHSHGSQPPQLRQPPVALHAHHYPLLYPSRSGRSPDPVQYRTHFRVHDHGGACDSHGSVPFQEAARYTRTASQ